MNDAGITINCLIHRPSYTVYPPPSMLYLLIEFLDELVLFPAFLLTPNIWLKMGLLGLLGFFNS
ncbi:MAG: hypothetical protein Q7U34_02050, partial [Anaerolineales bacterium]|nr:hypothetical protein [Anaerolineales bacterium]